MRANHTEEHFNSWVDCEGDSDCAIRLTTKSISEFSMI